MQLRTPMMHKLLLWWLLLDSSFVHMTGGNPCLEKVVLPPNFQIKTFTNGSVPKARSLTMSNAHNGGATLIYVSTRKDNRVYAVVDEDGDGVADRVHTVINDKRVPNGVAWRDGSLFVAQIGYIWRYDNVDELALAGEMFDEPELISDVFPFRNDHGWKYIAFGPDGMLYVPLGAPCNICRMQKFRSIRFGSICRMHPNGTGLEVYAEGIRNSVGFDWHPITGDLWFTDNGFDNFGDNSPDDELNRASEIGMDFGFPACYAQGSGNPYSRDVGVIDIGAHPRFSKGKNCEDYEEPVQTLGPHVAALGMKFYTGEMFPEEYQNSIFIAQHGSWNRKDPIGYRVVEVALDDDGGVRRLRNFAYGWLNNQTGDACGRPVDVLQLRDGSILVSDDDAGDIYRITYKVSN